MTAAIVVSGLVAWAGGSVLAAVLIGRAINTADREQAAGQQHRAEHPQPWDVTA